MTDDSQHRTAQQVIDQYRAQSRQRLAEIRQSVLPDPIFSPGAIVDPEDGTLDTDMLKGLLVRMPAWLNIPPEGDTRTSICELMWARAGDTEPPPLTDYHSVQTEKVAFDTPFPLRLTVPTAEMAADGRYYLAVRVEHWDGGTTGWTAPIPLICNSEPPYEHSEPQALQAPVEFITDEYLAANGDKVIFGLPQYADFQPGDRLLLLWGRTLPLMLIADGPVDSAVWPMPLEVSGNRIRSTGSGVCYAQYQLFDKANNLSRSSTPTRVNVALAG
jgi:hypothetical protein